MLQKMGRKQRLRWMERHIRIEPETGKFICTLCAKAFTRKDSVQNHVENFHMDFEGYVCDYCGQVLNSRNNKNFHIHYHHKEVHALAKAKSRTTEPQ